MATKKVRINSMQEVIDLRSIGVEVWVGRDDHGFPVGYWADHIHRYWEEDHSLGRYYYIEVEDS